MCFFCPTFCHFLLLFADMQIKASKPAYTSINSHSTFYPKVNENPIPRLTPNQTYKYLGVQICGDLNWSSATDSVLNKHKKTVDLIMSKFYLSTSHKIRLINSVANATPGYLFQFITPDIKEIKKEMTIQFLDLIKQSTYMDKRKNITGQSLGN